MLNFYVRGFINFAGCIADYRLSIQWFRYTLSYLLEYSFNEEDLSDHVMGYLMTGGRAGIEAYNRLEGISYDDSFEFVYDAISSTS